MKLIAASQPRFDRLVKPFLSTIIALLITSYSNGQSLLYGTTEDGGEFGAGSIYKANEDGTSVERIFSFPIQNEGANPRSGLLLHSNGFYYGVTEFGGGSNQGIFYRYDRTNNAIQKITAFTQGRPVGGLIEGSNGKIYGTTSLASNVGSILEFDPVTESLTETVMASATGTIPYGKLLEVTNGTLYGLARNGGTSNVGAIFSYDIASQAFTNLHSFSITDGWRSESGLLLAADGKLYGTATRGGANDKGTLFSFDLTNDTFTRLIDFGSANGQNPHCDLIQLSNGLIYGTTRLGGTTGNGTIFKFDPTNSTLTKIHDFNITSTGSEPYRGFTLASNGKLYAVAAGGGVGSNGGTLVELDPTNDQVTNLHNFDLQGANPICLLTEGPTGILIGTTSSKGAGDDGIIFEYDIANSSFSIKIDFGVAPQGESSLSPLVSHNGAVYGAVAYGGTNSHGVLFEFDPGMNTINPLHHFNNTAGSLPIGELIIGTDGKIYGTTNEGGSADKGTLFSYDPVNDIFAHHLSFGVTGMEGEKPQQGLVQAANGKLYGTTRFGGTAGRGTIFEFDPQIGIGAVLYSFDAMGYGPRCKLIQGLNGKLYGTAEDGGANGRGVIFSYDITNSAYNLEVSFGSGNGADPVGGLFEGPNGLMYGITSAGGATGIGIVYSFNPATSSTTAIREMTTSLGGNAWSRFQASPNGNLYLATRTYGTNNIGSIIELDTMSNQVARKSNMTAGIGRNRPGTMLAYCLPPVFDVTLSATHTVCAGDNFTLPMGSSNTTSYVWKKDNVEDPNITGDAINLTQISANEAGAYTVEMTNECGTSSFSFQLNVTEITATVTTTGICTTGDGIINISNVAGGTAPYEYSLDGVNYQASADFTGLTIGSYDVYIKENTGCVTTQSVSVGSQLSSTVTVTDVLCHGDMSGELNIATTGGAGPYEYSLDGTTFQTSASFTGLSAGSYTVYAKDTNGCLETSTADIIQSDLLGFTTTTQDPLCAGEPSGSITFSATGGAGNYGYTIDGGTGFLTSTQFTNLASGTYNVGVIDGNGCATQYTQIVLSDPPLSMAPVVSGASTTYGSATSSGLIIEPDNQDQVTTHFNIFSISGGQLFQSDGNTPIQDGDFITLAQGAAGLVFNPVASGTGSFQVQSAASDRGGCLGGNSVGTSITVSPAGLTVTALDTMRNYGATNPVFRISYSGFVNGEDENVLTTLPTAASTADASSDVGTYDITAEGGAANNYAFNYVTGTLTVEKAALTITAEDKEISEGDPLPELTVTYSGFVNNEDESVIDTNPSISTTATAGSSFGTYPITLTGGDDNNYALILVDGVLTITQVLGFENDPSIQVYPNPVTHKLIIQGDRASSTEILDFSGRVLVRSDKSQLDLKGLSHGTYLVIVKDRDGNELVKHRIIKK